MIRRYLPFTLTLRAPVVLTAPGGDPNSSRTLPFIPGSALRGAAAGALGDPRGNPEREREFRDLILDGSVRFLNAYPRALERRSLPAPVSMRVEKDASAGPEDAVTVWDLAAFSGRAGTHRIDWPEPPLAALPEAFVLMGAAQPLRVQPRLGSRIHQQRDRVRGKAWKEPKTEVAHGAIFVFEFLDAGQEFEGLILVESQDIQGCDDLTARIQKHLETPLLLGRSRRGGYGGNADIAWLSPRQREVDGQGLVQTEISADTEFCVLLTSAYIGRNPATGQIDPAHFLHELLAALSGRARVIRRRWMFGVTGGFNRKWRLEVPQAPTCAAGSVLVLEATTAIPFNDLLAIEHAGLGERRIEGFGRLVFLEAPPQSTVLRPVPDRPLQPTHGTAPDLVRFAEGRILDSAVRRAIAEEATRLAGGAMKPPTTSLLGRLRNALRTTPDTALETLRTWLGDPGQPKLKRPALEQLDRCRIGANREPFSSWLREMARRQGDQPITNLLRLDAIAQRSHIISQESARSALTDREVWIRVRLLDATLAALTRRKRSERSA